jgi:putative ABC transport system ATP-binding protein
MMESVGLDDRVRYYPENLSGRQKQRMAIARALVTQPKIVVADESTAGLGRRSTKSALDIDEENLFLTVKLKVYTLKIL